MPNEPNRLTLEKLEIQKKLDEISQYIKDGKKQRADINDTLTAINTRCSSVELISNNLQLMIHGDSSSKDKYIRDGMNRRLDNLEEKDHNVEKIKGNFLKVAVGSMTLAIGSAVIWFIKLVWSSVGK